MYVAETAKHLAMLGFEVDIFTRWEDPNTPKVVDWIPSVRVVHVNAGPLAIVPKEELLPFMTDFTKDVVRFIQHEKLEYALIHAHFFMSALVAADIKQTLKIPLLNLLS